MDYARSNRVEGAMEIFAFEYEWVNDGEWTSGSVEDKAIQAAKQAAIMIDRMRPEFDDALLHDSKTGLLWDAVYAADRVTIDYLQCPKPTEHINICKHLRVRFSNLDQDSLDHSMVESVEQT